MEPRVLHAALVHVSCLDVVEKHGQFCPRNCGIPGSYFACSPCFHPALSSCFVESLRPVKPYKPPSSRVKPPVVILTRTDPNSILDSTFVLGPGKLYVVGDPVEEQHARPPLQEMAALVKTHGASKQLPVYFMPLGLAKARLQRGHGTAVWVMDC